MNYLDLAEIVAAGSASPERHERYIRLDGPRLAEWIKEHHRDLDAQLGEDWHRLRDWEKGTPATVFVADRILTRLDSHFHQLPPELWIDKPKRRPRRKPERIAA